jgi:hypothetical protein
VNAFFVATILALGWQTATSQTQQRTQGACSPAVADVNGNVTITCTGMNAEAVNDLRRALSILQQLLNANDVEPISVSFPVSFYFRRADHLPLAIPDRSFPYEFFPYFDELLRKNPDSLKDDFEGDLLYHEFLQKSLFEWIAWRFRNWQNELLRFETGSSTTEFSLSRQAGPPKSRTLSVTDVEEAFAKNRFAHSHLFAFENIGQIALPADSKLSVIVPTPKEPNGQIKMTNRFYEFTIDTMPSISIVGLGGYGGLLDGARLNGTVFNLDIDTAQQEFWNNQFTVRVKAVFSESLANSPEMPLTKRWLKSVVNGLQAAFDEQIVWRKTVEQRQTRMQMGPNYRELVMPLGPIRFQQPAEKETPSK